MRKIVLGVLIVITCAFTAKLFISGFFGIDSMATLEEKKDEYEEKAEKLEKQKETFNKDKNILTVTLNNYNDSKTSYESMLGLSSAEEQKQANLGNYYDLEYLWTVIGTHAVKEGVKLGIVFTTSSKVPDNEESIYANINFTVIGEYRPISEFIEKCENDSNLQFSISSFKIVPYEKMADDDALQVANYLQATFTVKDVPLSADTIQLINNKVEDSAELQMNLKPENNNDNNNSTNAESSNNSDNNNNSIINNN